MSNFVSWVVGIVVLLIGLINLVGSYILGLCFISISFFILPWIRNFVYMKTNIKLNFILKCGFIFFIFVFSVAINSSVEESIERKHFNNNKEQIVELLETLLSENKYLTVVSNAEKYDFLKDKEILNIKDKAQFQLDRMLKAQKEKISIDQTKRFLEELKTIPASEYLKNKNLYESLLRLHPDNEKYRNKVNFYSKKYADSKIIKVSIDKILSDYESNEIRADNKYKGELIKVTGIVKSVSETFGNLYVHIGDGKSFSLSDIMAECKDSQRNNVSLLSKGKRVTIVGKVSGLSFMSVSVKDCKILTYWK